tara:strand:- start:2464 stop:4029 length:1566 start_codon:yes stop_codon:yes gene_type:complete
MEKDLIAQFNLPSYVKGKTFADASKAIEAKFKDRTDKTTEQTKGELLTRLSKAQEYVKMQQSFKTNSETVPDMMDGDIPPGMEEFMGGQNQAGNGDLFEPQAQVGADAFGKTSDVGTVGADGQIDPAIDGAGVAGYASLGTTALDMGRQMFGPTGVATDGSNTQKTEKVDSAGAALGGVAKGAKAGMMFGPWGAAVGGVIGGAAGLIGAGRANKDAIEANGMKTIADSSKIRQSDFANGGKMTNQYAGGSRNLRDTLGVNPQAQKQLEFDSGYSNPTAGNSMFKADVVNPMEERSNTERALRGGVDWLGQNAGNIAQYAPAVGNLMELKNLTKGTTARGSRVAGEYTPGQFDETALVNQVNQQNIERSLTESSGGDLGALRTNLIGAGAAKLKAQGEGMRSQRQLNIGENDKKFQYGRQKDMFNAQLDERYLERKAQDDGAFETAKASLRKGVTDSIGNIGKEEVDKKTVKEMFGYKWNGKYWTDKQGKQYSNKEVSAKVKEEQAKKADSNTNMFGGYLKK